MTLRDMKQLEDLQAMREASRLYRPGSLNVTDWLPLTERNPRNPWVRNCKAILGTITGRAK